MLKRIKKINKFGIFDQFAASQQLTDFSKFNLIYGWNGSGKTTLSKLLFCLSSKVIDPLFDECEFEIEMADGTIVKSSAMTGFPMRVMVLNQQFIEDNIDWKKQGAKSLLVIAEDKIEERKRFFEIKDQLIPAKEILVNDAMKRFRASEKERDDFLTQQAKAVKNALQLIDTSDSRYLNYDRTKIRNFIQENAEMLSKQIGRLDEQTPWLPLWATAPYWVFRHSHPSEARHILRHASRYSHHRSPEPIDCFAAGICGRGVASFSAVGTHYTLG